jgi:hypothetical protein
MQPALFNTTSPARQINGLEENYPDERPGKKVQVRSLYKRIGVSAMGLITLIKRL